MVQMFYFISNILHIMFASKMLFNINDVYDMNMFRSGLPTYVYWGSKRCFFFFFNIYIYILICYVYWSPEYFIFLYWRWHNRFVR